MSKSLRADAVTGLHNAYIEHLRNNGDIQSSRVEEAFRAVPRHLFLPDVPLERVYSDESILTKLQDGEVVSSSSQPAMMAIMLEQLDLQPGHHVLEVGAATGYNAGLMAHLVGDSGQVTTIDIDEDLVEGAREHLAAAGLASVTTVCGDGGLGYPDHAPYDRIILTVGAWDIVPAWWEQLRPGGRLLLPLEVRGGIQKSVAFDRIDDHLVSSSVNDCGFMPLRGDFAKPPDSIPLGPDPGLILSVDDPGRVDADAVYGLLSDPTELRSTGIRVSPREVIFGGLALWLGVQEPGFCVLYAGGEVADRGIVPGVMEFSGEWRSCWTNGLLADGSLCVFVRSPDQLSASGQPADPQQPFELLVRSFGSRTELAERLAQQVRRWDGAGRPANDLLRLKVHPIDADYQPSPDEIVVCKRWTQLILDWG
jgi:protein-L-isoaspartate(D-aspartate) O-methyltransferase